MRIIVPTIALILLCLSLSATASAPVIDDSENFVLLEDQAQAAEELPIAQEDPYTIADNVEESVTRHSRSPQNSAATTRNIGVVNQIQALQKEVQELRGQLEIQAHELEELKQQSSYQDLSAAPHTQTSTPTQIQQPTAQSTPTSPRDKVSTTQADQDIQPIHDLNATASHAVRINPADEQISYLAAYDLVKQKQFPQATQAMEQFLVKYPNGGYSANAHYWLGELHLANKNYAEAINQFDTIIHNFKSSSKFAPSRLKLGYALADSGHIHEAKKQLTAVMTQYPDTSTARLALLKLEKLGG